MKWVSNWLTLSQLLKREMQENQTLIQTQPIWPKSVLKEVINTSVFLFFKLKGKVRQKELRLGENKNKQTNKPCSNTSRALSSDLKQFRKTVWHNTDRKETQLVQIQAPTLTSFEPLDNYFTSLRSVFSDDNMTAVFVPTYFTELLWKLNAMIQVKNLIFVHIRSSSHQIIIKFHKAETVRTLCGHN